MVVLAALVSQLGLADESHREKVDFAREILPVLSNKCFVCHGPDSDAEVDLRLDSFAGATSDRGGYRAIDVNDPNDSELLVRIRSVDDPMPPEDEGKPLTDRERELLERWVAQGGKYAKHWAFVRPEKQLDAEDLSAAIDHFVGERLSDEEIDFSPPAERRTLARRVSLVLTGLPPEPQQLAQYLSDDREGAYERLVDQLLDSPRFGEQQARYWLDAVRYGDTHGLHLDNRRGIYPYRDWVVRAFNENLPLDDFITWQIAGDLLPAPTMEQKIATGYVRLNPSTGEGGAIPAEFQMKNNFDRVETLGTVFLGMSMTCARCHTHKYDPIPQTEYYRLLAFFNSTAEPAMDGNSYTYGPVARVPADQPAWQRWQALCQARDQMIATAIDGTELSRVVAHAERHTGWKASGWQISNPRDRADERLSTEEESKLTWEDTQAFPGTLQGRKAKGKLPGKEQMVWVRFDLEIDQEQTLELIFSGGPGSRAFLDDAEEAAIEQRPDDPIGHGSLHVSAGSHRVLVGLAGGGAKQELMIRIENRWDALAESKDWSACSARDKLRMLAAAEGPLFDPHRQREAAKLAAEIANAEAEFTTTLIAEELDEPRPTRLLNRGEYDLPVGDPLLPGILKVMSPFPEDAPRNRLGLAQWLTAPEHPTVTRVLVNRIWQQVFGHALVRTPEDFGLQGQQPTHPRLLDWMAVEMHQSGWNMKELLRQMVISRTFRQSSQWRDDIDDPENRLFARAASYRLDAEVLRDVGLWAGGLLDPHMGGEGVKPYQPPGMWTALAHPASNTKAYVPDQGERLFRRSLYVYWKRTSPHPMMTLFDAPDRESSCVRRSRTNTPLQSLGMLNEIQRVEMGRALAGRLLRSRTDDAERVKFLFQLLACRDPSSSEQQACEKLLNEMRRRFNAKPADALDLLSLGDSPPQPISEPVELASWTQLSMTVLASDVAILMY